VWLTFSVAAAVHGQYLNRNESVYFKLLLLKLFQSAVKQRFSLLRGKVTIGQLCPESGFLPRKEGEKLGFSVCRAPVLQIAVVVS